MEGRPLDDANLIERAKDGDVDAYSELVRRYQSVALRAAWVVAGGRGEVEDAAQEAFVKAYRALPGFRSGAAFKPWLLKIVTNEVRSRLRSEGRRSNLVLRAGSAMSTAASTGRGGPGPSGDAVPSPEVAYLDDEQRRELLAAMNRLGTSDREVLACRFFLDLGESETAEVLGCAKGTVKSRTSRALARLRALMVEGTNVGVEVSRE